MHPITNTNQHNSSSFSHPIYEDDYNLLSEDSKKEIANEVKELFKKDLQGFNGYKERFIKSRVQYWKTVEDVSKKIYFDVVNHANGNKTTNEKLSALSGISLDHPEFEKILTDAATRVLRSQTKCEVRYTDTSIQKCETKNKSIDSKNQKSLFKAILDKSDILCITAGTILAANGLYNLVTKNSDLIKSFFNEAATKASSFMGQTKMDDAVTLFASGVAVIGGAAIAKTLLKNKNQNISQLIKSKFESRFR